MELIVFLFDVRSFSSDQKNDIYKFIDKLAFMVNHIAVNNELAGLLGLYEHDPSLHLENIPHNCPYRNITGWDLSDKNAVFRAAFMNQ